MEADVQEYENSTRLKDEELREATDSVNKYITMTSSLNKEIDDLKKAEIKKSWWWRKVIIVE